MRFSEAEFSSRLDRVRAEMAADGLDCLFLTSPESLYYVRESSDDGCPEFVQQSLQAYFSNGSRTS